MLQPIVLLTCSLLPLATSVLLVDYQHFVAAPEEAVQQVLRFVGAETAR